MQSIICPCCSGLTYHNCCEPLHTEQLNAKNPEALMRSRYCAYALHLIPYLMATTHASQRHLHQEDALSTWANSNTWLRLEICNADENVVEFKAYYESKKRLHIHHERSTFKKDGAKWYYVSGVYFD